MIVLRKLTGLLCVIGIALCFLGCGKKAAVSLLGPGNNFNPSGMPIVKEPVELTVLTMRWGDMGDSFTKNQWLVDLEARSNIKIRWQVVSSSDWGEQKSILLASGLLPDIVLGNMTFNDGDIINNQEFFMPLDDLIDRYMPNYQKAMEMVPSLRSVSVFPDGKIYSLAKNLPARPKTRNHPIINKAWLDRLGLRVPATSEELTAVLKAFKNRDANGNGNPNDEYPLSFDRSIHVDMLNPFGITDINASMMSIRDGEPFFYAVSPEYRAAYKWVRELWEAGCIDTESFTQDFAMLTGKRLNASSPLVGMSFEWTHDAVFGSWSDQYTAIPPLAGPDGKRYAGGDPDGVFNVMRNEALIASSCKYPEAAARWLDEFYTSEASIQNFWGAIGTVITKNADGTYTLNDPPAGTSADAWYWEQSLRDFGPKFVEPDFNSRILLSKTGGDGLKMETSKIADPYVVEPYPNVIFTSAETEELATLGTDITNYVMQMQAQWLTRGGIDSGWDAYIRQLEVMGLERYVQIKTDAYRRYRAR
jgi:putative aldouronate transport system substrate-binding protein